MITSAVGISRITTWPGRSQRRLLRCVQRIQWVMSSSVGSTSSDYWLGNTKSPRESLEKGIELAQKALAMDDSIADAHALLCNLYSIKREYDKAIAEGERAVALNPNDTANLVSYAISSDLRRPAGGSHSVTKKQSDSTPSVRSLFILGFGHALRRCGAV